MGSHRQTSKLCTAMGPTRSTSIELDVAVWNDLDYLAHYFNTSKRALLVKPVAEYVRATKAAIIAVETPTPKKTQKA